MLQRWGPWGYFARPRATSTAFAASCTIEGGPRFGEKKSFAIESFHWGVAQTRKARSAEEEHQQTTDFSVVKRVDEVSPGLFQAAAQGDPIAKLEIVLAKGSSQAVYRFTDVFVTSVRPGGASGGSAPLEEVSFSGILESVSHSQ